MKYCSIGSWMRWLRGVSLAIVIIVPLHAQPSGGPPVLLSAPLYDVPGKNLVVVELSFPPNSSPPSTLENHGPGHRHPGSVYVYVTEGAVRLAIEGEPVQVVEAGGSFFEPAGVHHFITENASATEPARLIAVMIVPEGEPILAPVEPE